MQHDDSDDPRPPSRRRWWLLAFGLVFAGFAVTNPGQQAHRTALGNPSHTGYNNYIVFSTMTEINLAGAERQVSVGLLGTVYLW